MSFRLLIYQTGLNYIQFTKNVYLVVESAKLNDKSVITIMQVGVAIPWLLQK